jgi:hypothetical protein
MSATELGQAIEAALKANPDHDDDEYISWTDAELEAKIWATDEKATDWSVSIEEETEP